MIQKFHVQSVASPRRCSKAIFYCDDEKRCEASATTHNRNKLNKWACALACASSSPASSYHFGERHLIIELPYPVPFLGSFSRSPSRLLLLLPVLILLLFPLLFLIFPVRFLSFVVPSQLSATDRATSRSGRRVNVYDPPAPARKFTAHNGACAM